MFFFASNSSAVSKIRENGTWLLILGLNCIIFVLFLKQESKGHYREALKYFNVAAQVQPDDVGAHINVGRTLNNLGQYEEAEKVYLVRICSWLIVILSREKLLKPWFWNLRFIRENKNSITYC